MVGPQWRWLLTPPAWRASPQPHVVTAGGLGPGIEKRWTAADNIYRRELTEEQERALDRADRRGPSLHRDPDTWLVDAINRAFERVNECISRPGLDGFDLCLCQNALSLDLFSLGQGDGVQMMCPPPGTPQF